MPNGLIYKCEDMHVFLIGGADLEMITIIDILNQYKIKYIDRELTWNNAKLSSYSDIILKYSNIDNVIIYGIELKEDIVPPINYIAIDHHNLLIDRPSAIEQVLTVIDRPITRFQQLVAANDKGYIKALKEIGASDEEINEIRLLDRKAQGVTARDEELAAYAIDNHTEYKTDDLVVVKALSSKFSPICDRLYSYDRVVIYTDRELNFYGRDAQRLREKIVTDADIYYGGGDNGYWGVPQDSILQDEIIKIVKQIVKLVENA